MQLSSSDALANAARNRAARDFPHGGDSRTRNGSLYPAIRPKFRIQPEGRTIFAIGSCFARNIETALEPFGCRLPTLGFAAPPSEWPARPNGLLNEYNPGSMHQRILWALGGRQGPAETIAPSGQLFADLLLPGGNDVTRERAVARRAEIDAVYTALARSDYLIVTLGLVEAWYDNDARCFLNRMPPVRLVQQHPTRFALRIMDVYETVPLLEQALDAVQQLGIHTVLTVSPVPLQTTFTSMDCVLANEFSKSVLRVSAQRLADRFDRVDYFPSYEIVRSGGLQNYIDDQVHVRDEVVRGIMAMMLECYAPVPAVA